MADYGGDKAEDLLGGLKQAIGINWSPSKCPKLVFVITDAPCHNHGLQPALHDIGEPGDDYFDKPHPRGLVIDSIVKEMVEKDLMLQFCHVRPSVTTKMEGKFKAAFDALNREMDEGQAMFSGEQRESEGALHCILVLDESGSMCRSWNDLVRAVQEFVRIRRGRSQGECHDCITIIQFSDVARVTRNYEPMATVDTSLEQQSGGTAFSPALSLASEAVARTDPGMVPLLLFMSDGYGEAPSVYEPIASAMAAKNQSMRAYTVAFNCGVTTESLAVITRPFGNRGKNLEAVGGIQLSNTFTKVASAGAISKGLVEAAQSRIGGMIAKRIWKSVF